MPMAASFRSEPSGSTKSRSSTEGTVSRRVPECRWPKNLKFATKKMSSHFDTDQYPGRPRILFMGWGDSSHTHSWIDLLKDEPFNVRLFTTSHTRPPDQWKVRTYVTDYNCPPLDTAYRAR